MLYKKETNQFQEPELTQGMEIHELLKESSPQELRLKGYRMNHIQKVLNEAKRIESEVKVRLSGRYVVKDVVLGEDGELITPTEYFVPGTQANMVKQIESFLDVAKIVDDIRIWSKGNPSSPPSWTVFKNSFVNEG